MESSPDRLRPELNKAGFAVAHEVIEERTCVVSVEGELDLASAPQLKWTLVELLDKDYAHYVIDLSQLTYIDSMGLGVLVGFRKRVEGSAHLALAGLPATQHKLLEMTGLRRMLRQLRHARRGAQHRRRPRAAVPHGRRDGARAGCDRDAVRRLAPGRGAALAAHPAPARRGGARAVRARGR